MGYRIFDWSGLRVPELYRGTMAFGEDLMKRQLNRFEILNIVQEILLEGIQEDTNMLTRL